MFRSVLGIVVLLGGGIGCGDGRKNVAAASATGDAGARTSQGGTVEGIGGARDEPAQGGASGGSDDGAGAVNAAGMDAGGQGGMGGEAPNEVSLYCGDGVRDPVTEACDDASLDQEDSCSTACEPRNLLVVGGDRSERLARRLGFGRHPLAASMLGAAVVFTEIEDSSAQLSLARINAKGRRLGEPISLSLGLMPGEDSNPVLVALPDGSYVAAWADLAGGSLDIVLRSVTVDGSLGVTKLANATKVGAQYDADLIWTGEGLIAAWTDGFAVKVRTYSEQLEPTSGERTLSSFDFSGNVALAIHDQGWAAAFREPSADGEQVRIVLEDETELEFGPFAAGPSDERPALLSLDAHHLLLVVTGNVDGVPRLSATILNTNSPHDVAPVELKPLLPPYGDAALAQGRPALAKLGSRTFLAWQGASPLGDAHGQELFVQELGWSPDAPLELMITQERSLLLDWSRNGAQQAPALVAAKVGRDDVLLSVFEHGALSPSSNVAPDLVWGFVPDPVSLNVAAGEDW